MAHVFDDVKKSFVDYMQNNKEKKIEDWIILNKSLPYYKMPSKITLKKWMNEVLGVQNGRKRV